MRVFKLFSFAFIAFSNQVIAQEDSEGSESLPEPTMPENPFGDISLEEIIRTGTLDGVNEPSTEEQIKLYYEMVRYHDYKEAIAALHATSDANEMLEKRSMEKASEKLKNDFLISELAQMGLTLEDIDDEAKYTPEKREELVAEILERYVVDD